MFHSFENFRFLKSSLVKKKETLKHFDAYFKPYEGQCLPLSIDENGVISCILLWVMSLCEARNRTTSRFSFLIGTISRRHQNGTPARQIASVHFHVMNSRARDDVYSSDIFCCKFIETSMATETQNCIASTYVKAMQLREKLYSIISLTKY